MTSKTLNPTSLSTMEGKIRRTEAYEVVRTHGGTIEVLGYVVRRVDVDRDPWTAFATLTTTDRDWLGLFPTFGKAYDAVIRADRELTQLLEEEATMNVRIAGPNLNDQSKGTFHVHRDGCADLRKYGPGRREGGEFPGEDEMLVTDATKLGVVTAVYADHIAEDPELTAEQLLSDFWFAPCTKGIPLGITETID